MKFNDKRTTFPRMKDSKAAMPYAYCSQEMAS